MRATNGWVQSPSSREGDQERIIIVPNKIEPGLPFEIRLAVYYIYNDANQERPWLAKVSFDKQELFRLYASTRLYAKRKLQQALRKHLAAIIEAV